MKTSSYYTSQSPLLREKLPFPSKEESLIVTDQIPEVPMEVTPEKDFCSAPPSKVLSKTIFPSASFTSISKELLLEDVMAALKSAMFKEFCHKKVLSAFASLPENFPATFPKKLYPSSYRGVPLIVSSAK